MRRTSRKFRNSPRERRPCLKVADLRNVTTWLRSIARVWSSRFLSLHHSRESSAHATSLCTFRGTVGIPQLGASPPSSRLGAALYARNHPSVNYAERVIARRNLIGILAYCTADSPEGKAIASRGADVSRVHPAASFLFIDVVVFVYVRHRAVYAQQFIVHRIGMGELMTTKEVMIV